MSIRSITFSQSNDRITIVRDPLTIGGEARIIDAVSQMSDARISCSSIMSFPVDGEELQADARSSCIFMTDDQNKPVGVLTDRDIVRLSSDAASFQTRQVREVMTSPLITLEESKLTDLFVAMTLLQNHRIRHLPLVDASGSLTGIVTHETLRHAACPADFLTFRQVNEVMTTDVITASPEDSIAHVSDLMARDRVSCIVIVETGETNATDRTAIVKPVGLITERDIVQFHAISLDPHAYTAGLLMHVTSVSVSPSDTLLAVRDIMDRDRLACLMVTGQHGELVGIVTQSDLLTLINPVELYRKNEILGQRVRQLEADKISLLSAKASELKQQLREQIATLQAKAEREALMVELGKQIRTTLNVRDILETAVREVKVLLRCDCVMICRLSTDSGTESLELIDGAYSDVYIPMSATGLDGNWLRHYTKSERCAISDLIRSEGCPPNIERLEEGTCAKVVVPIVVGETLWGLLVVRERSRPRHWETSELEFLENLVVQIAIAIQHATAYEQLQIELSERHQAEIWWRESERRYYSLAEAVPVGIFRTSVRGHIQFINQRCLELLQLERSQVQRDTWLHRIHPDDHRRIQDARATTQRDGSPFQEEYRLQYEDGSIRWVSGQVVPSFDEAGDLQGYIGSIVDIHERKQAELSLQVVNQALEDRVAERTKELSALATLQSAIFEGTNYSIVATDSHGIILQMNTAAERLLGYRSSEVVERQSLIIFHDREELVTHAAQLSIELGTVIEPNFEALVAKARRGDASEHEWTYISKTGDRIPVAVSMTALLDPEGELLGFVGIGKNLSGRQRAEAKLRQLSERLSLAVTAGQVGIWDWDILNDRLDWNDRMYELYGIEKDSTINKYDTWKRSLHPDDLERCERHIKATIEGKGEFEAEFRIIQPDGTVRYIQAFSQTTYETTGKAVRMIGIDLDITDRKRSEQQLQIQAQRERLLRKITERIRQSLDIQTIFEIATYEIRQYLGVDRIGIFKFNENDATCKGKFIAESTATAYPLLLNVAIDDPCFDAQNRAVYENKFIQAIEDIDTANLDPCYHQMLAQLEVRANLVVPLMLKNGYVWGLLCIHQCHAPRSWSVSDIDFAEQLGSQLSIGIQQARLFRQLQRQLAEQKRKEDALQQQLTAIEASVDGIAILQDGVFIYVNQAHVRLFGYRSADEMIGQSWEILYSEDEKARFDREVFPVLITKGQWKGESVSRHTSGHHFYEELSLTQIDNNVLICVCRDISDRKRSEQALQQANLELARATRHKDEFLANMSHELRTPLNAILGMTEGLQEGMLGTLTDEQNKALNIVERGGRHLLDLINDILDLAKIEAGQVELNYTTAQMSLLCQASTSFVRQQAYKKSIALNVKTPEPDLNLRLDERRIRQVLINLLNNAVKFTPEGGTVTLEVTIVDRDEVDQLQIDVTTPKNPQTNLQTTSQNNAQDDEPDHPPERPSSQKWLRCSVTDTGIGIAPEDIDRLFRPFSQIDSALNRHYSGTGLGLALIKHIAELHGGTVGVRSEVGVGSEFWMLIPLSIVADDETALPPDHQPPTEVSTLPTNQPASLILLAEDNAANILTMSNYLEAKGYRIIVAKDGQEAIDVTQSRLVDLILMDIQMPTIDGLEAIGHIRNNPNYATVPIVALTALAMGGDRERCLAAGADDYLSKPVQLKQLVQTIQNLLGRTETQS